MLFRSVRTLVNLLTNAWKYSGDNKRIEVTARAVGRKIEIDVTDNGIGIDPAERSELFDGFVRGKAALEQRAPGAVGLAQQRREQVQRLDVLVVVVQGQALGIGQGLLELRGELVQTHGKALRNG